MIGTATILLRLIVFRFFRKNFSVFLLVSFFVFGIVQPPTFFFSEVFGGEVLDNPYLASAIAVIGGLYSLWVSSELVKYARHPDHLYLQSLVAAGRGLFLFVLTLLSAAMQLPSLIYFAVLARHGLVLEIPLGILYAGLIPLFVWWPAANLHRFLLRHRRLFRLFPPGFLSRLLPIHQPGFLLLSFLLQMRGPTVLSIKAISAALLFIVFRASAEEEDSQLLVNFALITMVTVQGLFPYWIFRAEDRHMPFLRSLPFGKLKRFAFYGMVYLVLMVPEVGVLSYLSVFEGHSPWPVLRFLLLFPGTMLLLQSLLLTTRTSMIDYVKIMFGFFIIQVILMMFSVPAFLIGAVFLLAAYGVFVKNYYRWEPELE